MTNFRIAFAGLMAAAALVAAAPAFANKANDTLVYASDSEPENVSPYHNNLREGVIIARHVFDNLIYRDPKTGKYQPQLATEWKWVDPQTLDLTIRKGVTLSRVRGQASMILPAQSVTTIELGPGAG